MSPPPKLLSEVTFGSFLVYSPRPQSDRARRFKDFVIAVKQDKSVYWATPPFPAIDYAARRLREEIARSNLSSLFGPQVRRMLAPCTGKITLSGDECFRFP